jgi:hypothetical protein
MSSVIMLYYLSVICLNSVYVKVGYCHVILCVTFRELCMQNYGSIIGYIYPYNR